MTQEHKDYEKRVPTTESERIAITSAKLAVTDAMNELFTTFGVDRSNFKSLEEFKGDIYFLRQLHKRADLPKDLEFLASIRAGASTAGKRVAWVVLSIVVTAFVLGMGNALKDWFIFMVTGKYPH